ncbi:hypothetical protein QRX50_10355 [Amycolatopsis carbonis]|uniref:Uncharacterized protein n=1 Tax=Amycolatopsis carbonis TaxID=715471 RepID=A0A9Y2MZI4_9PSEU|nr:hypothetical protein [Amycolatopsis sp. 2-15]WIX81129.1 hypothetical protein QRX50_10355 [Amycolatopsis sp. 2-15]
MVRPEERRRARVVRPEDLGRLGEVVQRLIGHATPRRRAFAAKTSQDDRNRPVSGVE